RRATAARGSTSASATRSSYATTSWIFRLSCAKASLQRADNRAMGPPGRRRCVRLALFACGAWLALHELRVLAFPGVSFAPLSSRFAHDVVLIAAAALTLARGVLVKRERTAWLLLGAGVLAWSFGEIYYTAVLWSESSPPIPSPADIGYLLFPL